MPYRIDEDIEKRNRGKRRVGWSIPDHGGHWQEEKNAVGFWLRFRRRVPICATALGKREDWIATSCRIFIRIGYNIQSEMNALLLLEAAELTK